MSGFSTVSKSSKSTEYGTPKDFFDKLNKIFRFSLDPCTTEDNPLGTERFFTLKENGLDQEWNDNTFINPPFGRGIDKWLRTMYEEAMKYPSFNYVMLLPARTDTRWFQDLIVDKYDINNNSVIYLLKGRLKFVNPVLNGGSEPHIIGSMLWMLNTKGSELVDLKNTMPGVLIKWYKKN